MNVEQMSRSLKDLLLMSRVSGDGVLIPRQQLHQLRVNKQLVTPDGSFFQHPNFNELLEIARRCLATGDVSFDKILDSAVGQVEDHINQLTAINFRRGLLDMCDGQCRQIADR